MMMMINIRRIIAANETRFADESHSLKLKRGEAEREKKGRRKAGEWLGGGGHRKERRDNTHHSI